MHFVALHVLQSPSRTGKIFVLLERLLFNHLSFNDELGSQLASVYYFFYLNTPFAHLDFWCNSNVIRRSTRLVSDLFRLLSDPTYESVHNFSIPTTTPPAYPFFELLFDIRYKGFKQRGAKWMIITASSAQHSPDTFSSTLILILDSM